MTDRSTPSQSFVQRLLARFGRRPPAADIAIDYDNLAGVEHHGSVVLLVFRDGSRHPITFATNRDATAWFGKANAGVLARREELHSPPELARLGPSLSDISTRPWSTPAHLSSILLNGLVRASVSGAVLERTDQGLSIRCHRFGRLHLAGTVTPGPGHAMVEHLLSYLAGGAKGHISLDGRFPGPALRADLERHPAGLHVRPKGLGPAFADLSAWGAGREETLTLRDLLSAGRGLILITGRSDSGKSTLMELCETEARVLMRPGSMVDLIDEVTDRETANDALKRSEQALVIAAIRADNAVEAIQWLKSLRIGGQALHSAIKGAAQTQLLPVQCEPCGGEGCGQCHRSGFSHRRGQLSVARLESMFHERDTVPPFERERRKLTA